MQHIRFIDFCHKDQNDFRYTVALIWSTSDSVAREAIYERAEDVVRETGWYPLPQGERLGSRLDQLRLSGRISDAPSRMEGSVGRRITGFEPAVKEGGGTAIRVLTDGGSLLLDSGLPGYLKPIASDDLLLLSHSHRDHSGGLSAVLGSDVTILTSIGTAAMLSAVGVIPEQDLPTNLLRVRPEHAISAGGIQITPFAVPHSPGALGFRLEDEHTVLVYPGDASFRTARHDFMQDLRRFTGAGGARRTILFLDATMSGREFGAGATDSAGAVMESFNRASDVFVISSDAEQLLYAYLDLFQRTKDDTQLRNRVSFIVTKRLKRVFRLVHAAFMGRELEELDPFVALQYGATYSAWAESRWLFWLEEMVAIPHHAPYRVWFITPSEIERITDRAGLSVLIGRLAVSAQAGDYVGSLTNIDTSAWSLHSSDATLREVIQEVPLNVEIILFHNFTSRLEKSIRRHSLRAEPLRRTLFA